MNGTCINCGGLVRGDRARCLPCELDAGLVLALYGEANCRNRAVVAQPRPKPGPYRSTIFGRRAPRSVAIASGNGGGVMVRPSDIHIDEMQARTAKDVPACVVCKRLPKYGHDSWCTPERRENAERDRLAIEPSPVTVRQGTPTVVEDLVPIRRDGPAALHELNPDELTMRGKRGANAANLARQARKETHMPTLAETVADLGMPAPTEGTPSPEHPIAMAECVTCGPKPRGLFSNKLNGDPFANCDPCRSAKAKAAHAARRTVNKPAESVNEAPSLVNEVPAPLTMADDGAPMVNQVSAQAEPIAPAASRTSGPNGDAALTTDRPRSAADLRAERDRVVRYLEDLDRQIEEAEVLEQLAGKTPEEIRQLLDDAQRQARLCQLALQGVA